MADAERAKWNVELSLLGFTRDFVGIQLLSQLESGMVRPAADRLCDANAYGCATVAQRALSQILGGVPHESQVRASVEHLLWCAWRTAQWRAGRRGMSDVWQYEGV